MPPVERDERQERERTKAVELAVSQIEKEYPPSPALSVLLEFIKNSERGICR